MNSYGSVSLVSGAIYKLLRHLNWFSDPEQDQNPEQDQDPEQDPSPEQEPDQDPSPEQEPDQDPDLT
jgi:hypothetical protein